MPGCGPTSRAVHGTPAGRTRESAKKFLLRDHAPPQPPAFCSGLWRRLGALAARTFGLRRAGLWPRRPGVVWPAAAPPASGGPAAGIRDPGSNAGSNAAAGTCVHSLCAGRSAAAVVALWHDGGTLAYHGGSPRERLLPRDSPGRMRQRSPRALIKTRTRLCRQSKALRRNKTENKTALEMRFGRRRGPTLDAGSLQTLATGSDFSLGLIFQGRF